MKAGKYVVRQSNSMAHIPYKLTILSRPLEGRSLDDWLSLMKEEYPQHNVFVIEIPEPVLEEDQLELPL